MSNIVDFQAKLHRYGLTNFEVQFLDYYNQVLPNRNGQKGTCIVAHTEGYNPKAPIMNNVDRTVFSYFNSMMKKPPELRANTHGSVLFSGKLVIYLPVENGSWGAGNQDINLQALQIETQDNGRYRNAWTYTQAQYNTWKRIFCAWKEYCSEKWGTDILFENSRLGILRHNQIISSRECPGELDINRIIREAKELWEIVNSPKSTPAQVSDDFYHVIDYRTGIQINAFSDKDNAFNNWYEKKDQSKVVFHSQDITSQFLTMATTLEQQITELKSNRRADIEKILTALNLPISSLDSTASSPTDENPISTLVETEKIPDVERIVNSINTRQKLFESFKSALGDLETRLTNLEQMTGIQLIIWGVKRLLNKA